MPKEFAIIDEKTLSFKYPSLKQRLTEVYTDGTTKVNLALSLKFDKAASSDLTKFKNLLFNASGRTRL